MALYGWYSDSFVLLTGFRPVRIYRMGRRLFYLETRGDNMGKQSTFPVFGALQEKYKKKG